MEAAVSCGPEGLAWEAELRCDYVPGGESAVEVLSPETIAGGKPLLNDTDWRPGYQGESPNAGTLSGEAPSPAACLPRPLSPSPAAWGLGA